MQSSQILKQRLTTEWAVTDPHRHVPKSSRVVGILNRSQARKATLVSTKYYYKSGRVVDDRSYFQLAPTSERSKGFLVTDGNVYWVAPAIDFVSKWAEAEKPWLEAEAAAKALQEAQEKRYERTREAQRYAQQKAQQRADGARDSIKAVLGEKALNDAHVNTSYEVDYDEQKDVVRPRVYGSVMVTLADWERLMEKLSDALDAGR